jgi:hypothetical protein
VAVDSAAPARLGAPARWGAPAVCCAEVARFRGLPPIPTAAAPGCQSCRSPCDSSHARTVSSRAVTTTVHLGFGRKKQCMLQSGDGGSCPPTRHKILTSKTLNPRSLKSPKIDGVSFYSGGQRENSIEGCSGVCVGAAGRTGVKASAAGLGSRNVRLDRAEED